MISANQRYRRLHHKEQGGYPGLKWKSNQLITESTYAFRVKLLELLAAKPRPKRWKAYKPAADVSLEDRQIQEIANYNRQGLVLDAKEEAALRAQFQSQVDEVVRLQNLRAQAIALCRKGMQQLADEVLVAPSDMRVLLSTAYSGNYSTQTRPSFYAEHYLRPWFIKLQELGCKPELEAQLSYEGSKNFNYNLYAYVEPYQADAVDRRISLEERCRLWKEVGANPFVYNPFIPHRIGSF